MSNSDQLSITGSNHTLVIFPAGFDPATQLASYNNPGVTGFSGSAITIPAGKTIIGRGSIDDHVIVLGAMSMTAARSLGLSGGFTVAGAGTADVYSVSVNDANSEIGDQAQLTVQSTSAVGVSGGGTLTQSGGVHTAGSIYVGNDGGSYGVYRHEGGSVTAGFLRIGYNSGTRGTYLLSGTGSLNAVIQTISFNGTADFVQSGGTNVANTVEIGTGGSATGTYSLSGGMLSTTLVSCRGTFIYEGGTLNAGGINVRQGGKMIVDEGGDKTLRINSLTIDATSKLDLNDNDLVVNSGKFTTIRNLVFTGYSTSLDTTKKGIISTSGQNSGGAAILALFDNALATASDYPFGSGQTISSTAIVGKYTYIGDTDWDGEVTPQDYTAVDANLGATNVAAGLSWFYGDTDFDGNITPQDYTGIDAGLGLGVGNPLAVAGGAVVPEPAGMAVLIGLGCMLRRRRR